MKRSAVLSIQSFSGAFGRTDAPTMPGINRRRRMVRLYMTAILLLSLMFILYIWQSTKIVEIRLRIQELERRTETLDTNNAVLRADISRLQSLSRIEKVAKTELGMVVPKRLCYIPMPAFSDHP